MDKDFVIYAKGRQITLAQAAKLDPNMVSLYIPDGGPHDVTNVHYCMAMLSHLSEINLIESWQYVGPKLPAGKHKKGRVY